MRNLFLCTLLILLSCSRSGAPARSPGETLKQYYAAVNRSDTATSYALSTSYRVRDLKPRAAEYFAMCYASQDTIRVISETPTNDTESEVLYTVVAYDRKTGARLDSGLVACTMIKESGEWKVSACHMPPHDVVEDKSIHDLNLGFEQGTESRPSNWFTLGGTLDPAMKHGGKFALHLTHNPKDDFEVGTNSLGGLLAEARGKSIRYTGWIKTKDVGEYAGLWWRVDGLKGEVLAFNNMKDSVFNGSHDWRQFSFELPVSTMAMNVNFGVLLVGKGEAWFDDLSIDTNRKIWKP